MKNNETFKEIVEAETVEALTIIAKTQMDCADVKLSIGTVDADGMVVHGGVYIIDCPAKVILALENAGFVLHMSNGKLSICYKNEVKE